MKWLAVAPSEAVGFAFLPPIVFTEVASHSVKQMSLSDIIIDEELTQGIDSIVHRAGLFKFVFTVSSKGYINETGFLEKLDVPSDALHYRTKFLNAYLVCFYSAMTEVGLRDWYPKMILSLRNVILFRERYDIWGAGIINGVNTRCPDETFYENSARKAIDSKFAYVAFEKLRAAMSFSSKLDMLELLNIHMHSLRHFEDHNYSISHTMSWTILEAIVNYQWGVAQVSLQENRNYRSAVTIKKLCKAGVFPPHVCQELDMARNTRNDFMHDLKPVNENQAQDA